jgi:hypothetical protein
MLSSFAPWCAETCISASEGESQKPHQGFAGQNPIPHRGIEWSKSTLALGLPEWAGKTASGPAVAANNGPTPVSCNSTTGICVPRSMVPPPGYSVLQQLKNKVVGFLCGSSPSGAIESWMEAGATKGAFTGAVAGAGIFGAPTFGIGGVPGAALGGTVGGIAGAGGGVLGGSMAAVVCSATGVYGSGS